MNSKKQENKANILFNLINDFQLEGTEASFKLSWKSFLKIRFLIGVRSQNIKIDKLKEICKKISMPDDYIIKLMQNFDNSNTVLFGFEESEKHCIYKVYLEFWNKNYDLVNKTKNTYKPKEPLLQYLGFKWDAFNNLQSIITKYYSFPYIPLQNVFKRIESILKNGPDSNEKILNYSKAIINYALQRIDVIKDPFIYLEVQDNKKLRKSFDINLYEAKIKIKDLKPYLYEIQKIFKISNSSYHSFLEQISSKMLGHFSGGFDKKGDLFLTFYYDI